MVYKKAEKTVNSYVIQCSTKLKQKMFQNLRNYISVLKLVEKYLKVLIIYRPFADTFQNIN